MALYYNLPVYKASYKLTKLLFLKTEDFAREYKYTIGQQIKDEAMTLIKNIYRANKSVHKLVHIEEARENVEIIRLQVRLMQDFGQLSLNVFVEMNQIIEEVSKQLTAWERYSKEKIIGSSP